MMLCALAAVRVLPFVMPPSQHPLTSNYTMTTVSTKHRSVSSIPIVTLGLY